MTNRKRNMLEAFQASAREGQEGVPADPKAGGAGGPFAETTQPSEPEPDPLLEPGTELPRVELRQVLGSVPLGKLAAAQLAVIVIAFFLGWLAGGAGEVAAQETSDPPRREETTVTPARPSSDAPPRKNGGDVRPANEPKPRETPYDDAFFNQQRNTITLRVAAYAKTARNAELAWQTYDYLYDQGLPVVRPVKMVENIYLFVGAAPSSRDLDDLKSRLRTLPGPNGGTPFKDAYAVNIDDYNVR